MTDLQKKMADKLGLSTEDFQPKKATKVDELEAQVLYTALMTDTLIEEGKITPEQYEEITGEKYESEVVK